MVRLTQIFGRLESSYHQILLNELLLRIPEHPSPLPFAADMVTAIILAFHELRDPAAARRILPALRRFGPLGWAILFLRFIN